MPREGDLHLAEDREAHTQDTPALQGLPSWGQVEKALDGIILTIPLAEDERTSLLHQLSCSYRWCGP